MERGDTIQDNATQTQNEVTLYITMQHRTRLHYTLQCNTGTERGDTIQYNATQNEVTLYNNNATQAQNEVTLYNTMQHRHRTR